ncbi:MAG: hypothetical protein ABEJ66_03550, partial [Candidatus Nanohaloarchaea archaeon]
MNRTYSTVRGRFTPVSLRVINRGNLSVPDVTISPELGELGEGWNSTDASVNNLSAGSEVVRSIH